MAAGPVRLQTALRPNDMGINVQPDTFQLTRNGISVGDRRQNQPQYKADTPQRSARLPIKRAQTLRHYRNTSKVETKIHSGQRFLVRKGLAEDDTGEKLTKVINLTLDNVQTYTIENHIRNNVQRPARRTESMRAILEETNKKRWDYRLLGCCAT
jgi:hypothetical protein